MVSAVLNTGIHYRCTLKLKGASKRKLPATFTSTTYHGFMTNLDCPPKLQYMIWFLLHACNLFYSDSLFSKTEHLEDVPNLETLMQTWHHASGASDAGIINHTLQTSFSSIYDMFGITDILTLKPEETEILMPFFYSKHTLWNCIIADFTTFSFMVSRSCDMTVISFSVHRLIILHA